MVSFARRFFVPCSFFSRNFAFPILFSGDLCYTMDKQ